MILFGLLFAINLVAGLVGFSVFIIGLANGTVTTANILLWAGALSLAFSLPWAAWLVRLRGRARLGTVLLLPVAGMAAAAMILILIGNAGNWR
jgi:hypothetical protein